MLQQAHIAFVILKNPIKCFVVFSKRVVPGKASMELNGGVLSAGILGGTMSPEPSAHPVIL